MGPRAPFFMASFSPHRSATDQPTAYPLTSPLVCVAGDVLRWGEDKVAADLLLGVCCSVTPRGVCPVASLPQKQSGKWATLASRMLSGLRRNKAPFPD